MLLSLCACLSQLLDDDDGDDDDDDMVFVNTINLPEAFLALRLVYSKGRMKGLSSRWVRTGRWSQMMTHRPRSVPIIFCDL